jgi:hypothetical protein
MVLLRPPLLSESLFSDLFIVDEYNPLHSFFTIGDDAVTAPVLRRFNNAAVRSYQTLIENSHLDHEQIAFSIQSFYKTTFQKARLIQSKEGGDNIHLMLQMHSAVENAIKLSMKLLASVDPDRYKALFVVAPTQPRSDVLETLVEIVYEGFNGISNNFKGYDDPFWMTAVEVIHDAFGSIGSEPDGMTPFQQRLTLKIIEKLEDNMKGYYPAICRVLLACVGPHHRQAGQTNTTAFNILKDAMYNELQKFPQLVATKPEKTSDYLPENVTYNPATTELTHRYRGGSETLTNLSALKLSAISLVDPKLRRSLTDEERKGGQRNY